MGRNFAKAGVEGKGSLMKNDVAKAVLIQTARIMHSAVVTSSIRSPQHLAVVALLPLPPAVHPALPRMEEEVVLGEDFGSPLDILQR